MRYKVRHVSKLAYAAPVSNASFNLRLVPRLWTGQVLQSQSLRLSPEPARRADLAGPYWVTTTQIGFEAPLKSLEVASEFVIDVPAPEPSLAGPPLQDVRAQALEAGSLSDLAPAPYLFASRIATMNEGIALWAAEHLPETARCLRA